ncbi:hypothetical protein [Actinokineospora spheciospongiae]|uniref:hypothetical protein n=1 Tax=Actinokineospora spheciospongiae TaxID=909613 RepID=UPI000D709C1E|nr:hypothetical protein [Actinokineospora spheciospongiae]PWW50243.1 hypothetical protein DFQ13_1235 [Actinokineospora spheciospongiae]
MTPSALTAATRRRHALARLAAAREAVTAAKAYEAVLPGVDGGDLAAAQEAVARAYILLSAAYSDAAACYPVSSVTRDAMRDADLLAFRVAMVDWAAFEAAQASLRAERAAVTG